MKTKPSIVWLRAAMALILPLLGSRVIAQNYEDVTGDGIDDEWSNVTVSSEQVAYEPPCGWEYSNSYSFVANSTGPYLLQGRIGTTWYTIQSWYLIQGVQASWGWCSDQNCAYINSYRLVFVGAPSSTRSVRLKTFIPHNNVDPVSDASGGTILGDEVHEGDNRVFSYTGSFRTQIVFTAVGLSAQADADGIVNGSIGFSVGTSRSYDRVSSLDGSGNITSTARADTTLHDGYLKVDEGTASTTGMSISPSWIATDQLRVRCITSATNPLISGAPSIDFDVYLTIDFTSPSSPTYTLTGEHDGFPAYEFYIKTTRIYDHDPIATNQGLLSLGAPMEFSITGKTGISLP